MSHIDNEDLWSEKNLNDLISIGEDKLGNLVLISYDGTEETAKITSTIKLDKLAVDSLIDYLENLGFLENKIKAY